MVSPRLRLSPFTGQSCIQDVVINLEADTDARDPRRVTAIPPRLAGTVGVSLGERRSVDHGSGRVACDGSVCFGGCQAQRGGGLRRACSRCCTAEAPIGE